MSEVHHQTLQQQQYNKHSQNHQHNSNAHQQVLYQQSFNHNHINKVQKDQNNVYDGKKEENKLQQIQVNNSKSNQLEGQKKIEALNNEREQTNNAERQLEQNQEYIIWSRELQVQNKQQVVEQNSIWSQAFKPQQKNISKEQSDWSQAFKTQQKNKSKEQSNYSQAFKKLQTKLQNQVQIMNGQSTLFNKLQQNTKNQQDLNLDKSTNINQQQQKSTSIHQKHQQTKQVEQIKNEEQVKGDLSNKQELQIKQQEQLHIAKQQQKQNEIKKQVQEIKIKALHNDESIIQQERNIKQQQQNCEQIIQQMNKQPIIQQAKTINQQKVCVKQINNNIVGGSQLKQQNSHTQPLVLQELGQKIKIKDSNNQQKKQEIPQKIQNHEILISKALQFKNLGNQYFKSKNYIQAVKNYRQALNMLDPNNFYTASNLHLQKMSDLSSNLLYNIGVCYFNSNQWQRAQQFFNEALLINKKYVKAFYKRALCYHYLKLHQKALNDIKIAFSLQKTKQIHEAYDIIIQAYNQMKRIQNQQMKKISQKIFRSPSEKKFQKQQLINQEQDNKCQTKQVDQNVGVLAKIITIGAIVGLGAFIYKKWFN